MRLRRLYGVTGILSLLFILFYISNSFPSPPIDPVFKLIFDSKPLIKPLKYNSDDRVDQVFANTEESLHFTRDYLDSFLDLSASTKMALKSSYTTFLEGLSHLSILNSDSNSESFFGNNVTPESRGIVIVGGGRFTWLALLNIVQIRSRNCKLPVEIFIPPNEPQDREFCNKWAPQLNARCIYGDRVDIKKLGKLSKFQWKILAMYYSSFHHVLFLDADNTVLENPELLFTWDQYQQDGLILWPDAWTRTTNPFFYDLIGKHIDITGNEDKQFHALKGTMPDPTNESGMILVNKLQHRDTLLLALYFNIYGPNYYYPLLTQGGAGEGDKDTFLAAAWALDAPFYTVHHTLHFVGYIYEDEFQSKALAHCNPLTRDEARAFKMGHKGGTCSGLMFIHMSYPKYLFETINDQLTLNDQHLILYETLIPYVHYDFELEFWELYAQLICRDWSPISHSLSEAYPYKSMGLHVEYIQKSNVKDYCHNNILPHLKNLRSWFQDPSNKRKSQFSHV